MLLFMQIHVQMQRYTQNPHAHGLALEGNMGLGTWFADFRGTEYRFVMSISQSFHI